MDFDVIVVGGGPAGSIAAKLCAEKGLKVICIDRETFPRVKPCGGAVPRPILNELPYLYNYIETRIDGLKMFGKDPNEILQYSSGKQQGAFVIRSVFDNCLLQDASKAGVKLVEGERVIEVNVSEDEVRIKTEKNHSFSGKIVIGADGTNSVVAKKTGLNLKWEKNKLSLVYVIESEVKEDVMEKYFPDGHFGYMHMGFNGMEGYGWIFPKKTHINIGFGAMIYDTKKIKDQFQNYINFCERTHLIPKLELTDIRAALLPMGGPLKRTSKKRVMLLGDAAGFVNPINGEGIHYAMKSGIIAAEIALKSIKSQDYGEKIFLEYHKKCMKAFGKDLRTYLFLRRRVMNNFDNIIKIANQDESFKKLFVSIGVSLESPRKNLLKIAWKYGKLKVKNFLGTKKRN